MFPIGSFQDIFYWSLLVYHDLMETVSFQQDLSGMSCLLFPGRLLHSCTGSPSAGSSQVYHCKSIIFPEGFCKCEIPLWDFWNSSKKTFENLKIHFTSLCCTFSTCHLWELEAAQMGKPVGSTPTCPVK